MENDDLSFDWPGIYTKDLDLMKQISHDPVEAEKLLRVSHSKFFIYQIFDNLFFKANQKFL